MNATRATRRLRFDYIALFGLWIVWIAFLLKGQPITPVSPFQNFRNPIHDARPVVSPRDYGVA